ncbi:hypothetical protein RI129_004298 [Pyrocoelia pectoralis]|uniref:DUF4774 domain-containing protein n=1 Tax=Pyrocoelia pectoralis TaxID=417401 RepID=A0AAN7VGH1_9COLE
MFSVRLMVVMPILVVVIKAQSAKSELGQSAKHGLPIGPSGAYSPDIYHQFGLQYPGLGYVPDKQFYPGAQPPILYYGGGAIPGQQFLYRPGSPPPGNFLIPQPSPGVGYPQPVPGVGYPQTPVFQAGYPKPAHIPPIEKDAEEVPDLAGNHPPTRTGRPFYQSAQPERIETFDEPVSASEQDDLEEAEKIPNNFFPKKAFPARPILKPGQQFFILNGNTLFSNVPVPEPQIPRQVYQQPQQQQPIYHQPQFLPQPEKPQIVLQPVTKQGENYVSLNNVADFRQPAPIQFLPYPNQPQVPVAALVIAAPRQTSRTAKNLPVTPPLGAYYSDVQYPFIITLDNNRKEDDDTVTIEARPVEELKKVAEKPVMKDEAEPSLSQAKPSALALSGKGGVASAGPRGTALVGIKGVAIASPEATAVAGPTKDEPEKPEKKMRPKKEKQ